MTAAGRPLGLALAMWGLAALFYLIDFFHRVSPAALAEDLSRDLAPTAASLGTLSSAYFITYALLQVPLGMLVDRFGPRRIIALAALFSSLGALGFAVASSLETGWAGRMLLGASGAVAWTAMLKVGAHWFSPAQFARISGLSLSVGALGAILSGLPLRAAADALGWRTVILLSSSASALLAIAVWRYLRDSPGPKADDQDCAEAAPQARPMPTTPANTSVGRNLLWHCLGQMGMTGSMAAVAWLWAVPYLTQVHGLTAQQATSTTSLMMVFMAAGALTLGAISDVLRNRQMPLALGTLGVGLALLGLGSGWAEGSVTRAVALLWMMGLASGAMVLAFALGKDLIHDERTGTVVAVVNFSVMLGSIVLPPAFGLILDAFWAGAMSDGVRIYTAEGFRWAFLGLGLWVLLTLAFQRGVRLTPAPKLRPPPSPSKTQR